MTRGWSKCLDQSVFLLIALVIFLLLSTVRAHQSRRPQPVPPGPPGPPPPPPPPPFDCPARPACYDPVPALRPLPSYPSVPLTTTIQAAINSVPVSGSGTIQLVAGQVYAETILVTGRNIRLQGDALNPPTITSNANPVLEATNGTLVVQHVNIVNASTGFCVRCGPVFVLPAGPSDLYLDQCTLSSQTTLIRVAAVDGTRFQITLCNLSHSTTNNFNPSLVEAVAKLQGDCFIDGCTYGPTTSTLGAVNSRVLYVQAIGNETDPNFVLVLRDNTVQGGNANGTVANLVQFDTPTAVTPQPRSLFSIGNSFKCLRGPIVINNAQLEPFRRYVLVNNTVNFDNSTLPAESFRPLLEFNGTSAATPLPSTPPSIRYLCNVYNTQSASLNVNYAAAASNNDAKIVGYNTLNIGAPSAPIPFDDSTSC